MCVDGCDVVMEIMQGFMKNSLFYFDPCSYSKLDYKVYKTAFECQGTAYNRPPGFGSFW